MSCVLRLTKRRPFVNVRSEGDQQVWPQLSRLSRHTHCISQAAPANPLSWPPLNRLETSSPVPNGAGRYD
ncbi:unnamed protein product [Protopolystoma xenopodis]|uniref:Uncharacterized protein n=1 Tax=Protopolystoma xenopodis TaxID=117903 RepID=A0A3S5CTE2_9PLAT|nr:unnamed protein product [Protopolystoma xenopodis]